MSASFVDFYRGRPEPSPKTLDHLSKAYSLVNKRLSSEDALSDKVMAAVITLTLLEWIHHQHHRARMHFEGLKRMVDLRGGLSRLMTNRALVHKIWRCETFCTPSLSVAER
jgi:hypothetical protein